ncbi:hypothetical protein D9611_010495 [Ephemerocybe angulata]|uniref:Uncharacterized protein n=1 Tax=Ephemerocybe angulata TaxID=980116 RepID=A0A8H5FAZ8_9AGAR|nr:hypothetical protein D9611_010495 [Tulosesus angulatus]
MVFYGPLRAFLLTLSLLSAKLLAQVIQETECTDTRGFTLCQMLPSSRNSSEYQHSAGFRSNSLSVSWSTEYNWSAGSDATPKSYASVESKNVAGVQLKLRPILTTAWLWKYVSRSSSDKSVIKLEILVGNSMARGTGNAGKVINVQVWLSGKAGGVQPSGTKINDANCVCGYDWSVYRHINGLVQTITFMEISGEEIPSFDADLGELTDYLIEVLNVPETFVSHPSIARALEA